MSSSKPEARRARHLVVHRLVAVLVISVGIIATAVVGDTASRAAAAPAMRLCVLASTGYVHAVERGVALLDTAAEVDAVYRTVEHGCADGKTEVVVVDAHKGADAPSAYTHRDGDRFDVVLNLDHWSLDRHDAIMVALHELMHVVLRNVHGADWDEHGHTSRCDSVMSANRDCILALDGLTAYDRATIARATSDSMPR